MAYKPHLDLTHAWDISTVVINPTGIYHNCGVMPFLLQIFPLKLISDMPSTSRKEMNY